MRVKLRHTLDRSKAANTVLELADDDGNVLTGSLVQSFSFSISSVDNTPRLTLELIPTEIDFEVDGVEVTNREQLVELCRKYALDGSVYSLPVKGGDPLPLPELPE